MADQKVEVSVGGMFHDQSVWVSLVPGSIGMHGKPFTDLLGSPLAELQGIRNVFPILVLTRKGS